MALRTTSSDREGVAAAPARPTSEPVRRDVGRLVWHGRSLRREVDGGLASASTIPAAECARARGPTDGPLLLGRLELGRRRPSQRAGGADLLERRCPASASPAAPMATAVSRTASPTWTSSIALERPAAAPGFARAPSPRSARPSAATRRATPSASSSSPMRLDAVAGLGQGPGDGPRPAAPGRSASTDTPSSWSPRSARNAARTGMPIRGNDRRGRAAARRSTRAISRPRSRSSSLIAPTTAPSSAMSSEVAIELGALRDVVDARPPRRRRSAPTRDRATATSSDAARQVARRPRASSPDRPRRPQWPHRRPPARPPRASRRLGASALATAAAAAAVSFADARFVVFAGAFALVGAFVVALRARGLRRGSRLGWHGCHLRTTDRAVRTLTTRHPVRVKSASDPVPPGNGLAASTGPAVRPGPAPRASRCGWPSP